MKGNLFKQGVEIIRQRLLRPISKSPTKMDKHPDKNEFDFVKSTKVVHNKKDLFAHDRRFATIETYLQVLSLYKTTYRK